MLYPSLRSISTRKPVRFICERHSFVSLTRSYLIFALNLNDIYEMVGAVKVILIYRCWMRVWRIAAALYTSAQRLTWQQMDAWSALCLMPVVCVPCWIYWTRSNGCLAFHWPDPGGRCRQPRTTWYIVRGNAIRVNLLTFLNVIIYYPNALTGYRKYYLVAYALNLFSFLILLTSMKYLFTVMLPE